MSREAARLERRKAALALRPSISPTGPAPERLRVATWNLNSLRARLAAVERFLERVEPDIVCFQETKAPALSEAATVVDGTSVIVAGDVNVAATDSGVFHPDAFIGSTHVTPREREALSRLDATWIDHTERGMDRPSDHAALLADFHLR